MLRSASSRISQQLRTTRRWTVVLSPAVRQQQQQQQQRQISQLLPTAVAASSVNHRIMHQRIPAATTTIGRSVQPLRALSTQAKDPKKDTDGSSDDNDATKEIVLTPGEKVVVASRLGLWAGILAFAGVCGFYIVKELMPTKMGPNSVFDRSFEVIRNDPQIRQRFGESLKAYGRDHGGHREGRRNFIEHTDYVDPQDGSKRMRVRYNMEGQFGNAFVFAEVSADQPWGEYVYILVQDKANGRTYTVVDNRAAMTAARLAGNNKEASSAMSQLLTGNSKK